MLLGALILLPLPFGLGFLSFLHELFPFSSWPVFLSRPYLDLLCAPLSIPAYTLKRRPVAHEKRLALIPPLNYREDIIICHMGHIPSGLILQLCMLWI